MGKTEFNGEIEKNIQQLNSNLSKSIINAYQLKTFIAIQQAKQNNRKLLPNDAALIFYYNALVKQIESNLQEGDKWIPEQIILSLLSEWILEEGKSIYFYPFLKEID